MADVHLKKIHKSFGKQEIIKGIDLVMPHQKLTVFVGPSGCGKSTLLRIIAGLEVPTSGEVWIGGKNQTHSQPANRGVGMVFQSYALYPHMNVYQNMAFGLKVLGIKKAESECRIQEAAKMLGLESLLQRMPKELSGGQRQRVAMGRAIVRRPEVFLFDEPLSNLDAALRLKMRGEIAKLKSELKATMVYVTHDQVEAMTLADQMVVLREGRVEQVGAPLELYQKPCNQFVAGFIGSPSMNFIEAFVKQKNSNKISVEIQEGNCIELIDSPKNDSLKEGDLCIFGIRPEHFKVSQKVSPFSLNATVSAVEHLGDHKLAYFNIGTNQYAAQWVAQWVAKIPVEIEVKVGTVIDLGIDPNDCHLFEVSSTSECGNDFASGVIIAEARISRGNLV